MKRREFIAGLSAVVAASPIAGRAQPGTPVVGYLLFGSPETSGNIASFRKGLSEAGCGCTAQSFHTAWVINLITRHEHLWSASPESGLDMPLPRPSGTPPWPRRGYRIRGRLGSATARTALFDHLVGAQQNR